MCPPNNKVAKLREYRRLNRLNREQMTEEMCLESETNNICLNASRFSLVNVQLASFATGASAIFVVAIIALAVIICCWQRAKGQRRSKHLHSQLLSAVTSAIVPGPPSSKNAHRGERPEVSGPDVSPFEAAKWFRTPSGWASVLGAYLPAPGVLPPQLPFPQFPPLVQDFDFGSGGYQGYPMPQLEFRGRDAVPYHKNIQPSGSNLPGSLSCETNQNPLFIGSVPDAPRPSFYPTASLGISVKVFLLYPILQHPVWVGLRCWVYKGRRRGCLALNEENPDKEKKHWSLFRRMSLTLEKTVGLYQPTVCKLPGHYIIFVVRWKHYCSNPSVWSQFVHI